MKLDNASSDSVLIIKDSLGCLFPTVNITGKCVMFISSEICSLTATLVIKDNPSSDAILSENSSSSQETFAEGQQVHF